jgi:hypothetical protein
MTRMTRMERGKTFAANPSSGDRADNTDWKEEAYKGEKLTFFIRVIRG